jgi:hypothetical protein
VKKLSAFIITAAILATMAAPTFAQRRRRVQSCDARTNSAGTYYGNRVTANRVYANRAYANRVYSNGAYANQGYYDNGVYYDYNDANRSFWDRHRDKLTVAIGSGAGAAIGGATGGKKGAVIGALLGAGGSALYTYKIRNRYPN